MYFNPRSHEGSDFVLLITHTFIYISIHAPTRGATSDDSSFKYAYLFQSTLPRGERRVTMGDKTLSHKFQSTLPRGERRYSPGTVHRQWHYFNPRSHEGSDVQKLVDKLSDITDFNPRSHEGSDYDKRERLNTDEVFQSTLPRGERRCINDLCIRDTQFQSTLPRGERPNRTVN